MMLPPAPDAQNQVPDLPAEQPVTVAVVTRAGEVLRLFSGAAPTAT
jgi:hypothetical protein